MSSNMITDPSSLLNCAIDINQNSSYCDPVINQKTKKQIYQQLQ